MEFRPKSPLDLARQVNEAEGVLNTELIPSNSIEGEILALDIQEKYKVRYHAYVTALRAKRSGNFDSKDIKQASEWIEALNNLDSYITDHESKNNPDLRQKQFLAFKAIRTFLEEGKTKGYVKLPTGVGKTRLFTKLAEALGLKTIIVAPTVAIMEQNNQEIEEQTKDIKFGKYYSKKKDIDQQILNTTYQSLVSAVNNGSINPDDVPLLILDEAHRMLGKERTKAINKFSGIQLGFTATPDYGNDRKVSDVLSEEIFSMDIGDAIREGLACRTQVIHAYTDIDLSGVKIKDGRFEDKDIEKAVNVASRNMSAVKLYKETFSQQKAFCNCSGVTHAQDVAKLFNNNGIPASCITGDTPFGDDEGQRGWILKKYASGEIKVLTNARALLEGFNEPTCDLTLNLHPVLSRVDAEQRARSGRLDSNNPKKWNYVVDFIDKNAKSPQVLYYEILGNIRASNLVNDEINEKTTKTPSTVLEKNDQVPPIDFSHFSSDNLKIVFDVHEIMSIESSKYSSTEKKTGWKYIDLQADILAKGVNSLGHYRDVRSQYGWPIMDSLGSLPGFPKNSDGSEDWSAFFGKEKMWTYEALQADVLSKGIASPDDYRVLYSLYRWPSVNELDSLTEFPLNHEGNKDWYAFLRKEEKTWTYEALQADVLSKEISSSEEYKEKLFYYQWPSPKELNSLPGFPKYPNGQNNWSAFLEKEKIWTYENLRPFVLSQEIKSITDYEEKYTIYHLPSLKALDSMVNFPKRQDGKNDLEALFRVKEKFKWTYESLRKDVQSKKISSPDEYVAQQRNHDWPPTPALKSIPGFPIKRTTGGIHWDAFLSKETSWTYENLRTDVLSKGVVSSQEYGKKLPIYHWPAPNQLNSLHGFPKNPDGTKNWRAFLDKENT